MASNVTSVEKFQKLCTLVLDDAASDNEKRNAAVKAIELLAEQDGDLLVIPKSELAALRSKVEGADTAIAKVKEAQQKGMLLGGALGFMLAKGGIGR